MMSNQKVAAVLLTAPGCPHCAGMKTALHNLLQQGALTQLEIIDLAEHPDIAERYGVRSVPWCELGRFELPGAHSEAELRQWAGRATEPDGMFFYLSDMLGSGQVATAERVLRRYPEHLPVLLQLMRDEEQSINVQIGIGVLFESFQDEPLLAKLVPELAQLSVQADGRVRADACHYLSLTGNEAARSALAAALQDIDPQVREIAADGLERLDTGRN